MKIKATLFAAATALLYTAAANAGTLSVPVTTSATINSACTTSTSTINYAFGNLKAGDLSSTKTPSAGVAVSCTSNTPYRFSTSATTFISQLDVGTQTQSSSTTSTNPNDCQPGTGAPTVGPGGVSGGISTGNVNAGTGGVNCTTSTTPASFQQYGTVTLAVSDSNGGYMTLDTMSPISPSFDSNNSPVATTTLVYARLAKTGQNGFTDANATFPTADSTYAARSDAALYITY